MAASADRSLEGVTVFRNVPEHVRTKAEARCAWTAFPPRAEIVAYQDQSNDVFFIVRGHVRVIIYSSSGRAVAFRDMQPGEMFGELAAIDGQDRSASVEAVEHCLIARMKPGVFWDLLLSEPSLTKAVLLHLTNLIRSLSTRVYEFSTLAVQNRIHAELLRLARQGRARGAEVEIRRPPTHSEIASSISTHREAVARELSRLCKLGIIDRQGRALRIKNIHRLIRMVEEAKAE